jgi:hypothetical protein
MEIIALADIHGDLDFLPAIGEAVGRADLVLIAGDITNFGGRREMRNVLLDLQRYTPHVFAVPGNCDGPAVNQFLFESKVDLHCRRVDFQDWTLLGLCSWLACPHAPQPADARDIVKGSLDWLAIPVRSAGDLRLPPAGVGYGRRLQRRPPFGKP